MPIPKGVITSTLKAGKALKGAISSASKRLEGTLYEGKAIKKVVKGRGDWRYIVTDDDAVAAVSKDVVNSLSRAAGTAGKMAEFNAGTTKSRLTQAYKSLTRHVNKATKDVNKVLTFHNDYVKQLKLTGAVRPKMSLVKTKEGFFTFPTNYAKVLEKERALKVVKDLK